MLAFESEYECEYHFYCVTYKTTKLRHKHSRVDSASLQSNPSYRCIFIGSTIRITHIPTQAHTLTRLRIQIYKFTGLYFLT